MNSDEVISDLLLRWEQLREQGIDISVRELCSHSPQFIPELEEQVRALLVMDALVDAPRLAELESKINSSDSRTTTSSMSTHATYSILRSHAKGGLGEVFVARDERLGRDVALKVIRQPYDRDPQRMQRFIREAEITSQLEHPGIVPVHGIGRDNSGRLCYTMRMIGGDTLQQAINQFHRAPILVRKDRSQHLALRQLIGRFVSVCNTIAYAHSQGVIHRDLKPTNIMLGKFGETLVVDWGLAKKLDDGYSLNENGKDVNNFPDTASEPNYAELETRDEHDQLTMPGTLIGTPAYMSPEQSRGEWIAVGPASDIYSLGTTLYVMLTGRAPFAGRNIAELKEKLQRGDFLPPHSVQPNVARPLESICMKAMALDPKDRYSTALEMAEDFERWLADESVSSHRESWLEESCRWMRRHRSAMTSVAASGLVALVGLAGFLVTMSLTNDRLRTAYRQEGQAKTEALNSAEIAMKNAELAGQQSELALRSLQSVTFDIQRQLKHVPAAHKVRRSLLDTALKGLAEVAATLELRPKVDHSLLVAHRDLGDILFEVGSDEKTGGIEAAREQFQRALDIARLLTADNPNDRDSQRELARCYDRLGDIDLRNSAVAAGRDHYQQSLVVREKLQSDHPEDAQTNLEVSISLNKLGEVTLQMGEVESARDYYAQALELRRRYTNDSGSGERARELAVSLSKLGLVTLKLGNAKQAFELFQSGWEICLERSNLYANDFLVQRDLSKSLGYLGEVSLALGNLQGAANYYGQSLDIDSVQAAADPANALAQRDVMQSSLDLAHVLAKLGQPDEACSHLQQAVDICEKLVASDPSDSRGQRDLALAYNSLADAYLTAQRHQDAIASCEKSLEICKKRVDADPSDLRAPRDVAIALTKLGDGLLASKQVDRALMNYRAAIAIHLERSAANPSNTMIQSNLAAYYQRVGVACRQADRFEEASGHYRQALQIADKLTTEHPDNIPFHVLRITVLHSLGLLDQTQHKFAEAYKWCSQGRDLAKLLTDDGKLVGDDATWVPYFDDAIKQCREDERTFTESTIAPKPLS